MGNPFKSSKSNDVDTDPWSGVQPYLTRLFREGQENVLDRPLEFFPGSTAVPFSPETEFSLGAQTGRSVFGNPLNPAAQQQVGNTIAGDYFGQGAGFDAAKDAVTSSVMPAVDSQFGRGGRFGGPLQAEALGRGVSRGLAPYLDAERNRMMEASAMAPDLAREDYFDIGQLGQVGAQREDLYGRTLQDQVDRWNFGQQEPFNRISNFSSLIQPGLSFSEREGQQVYSPNTALTAAGLGLSAAGKG